MRDDRIEKESVKKSHNILKNVIFLTCSKVELRGLRR